MDATSPRRPRPRTGERGAARRGRRWSVAGGGLLLFLVAGCSGAVDRDEVEQKVADELTAQVGQAPESITCPDDLAAEVGTRMRCRLRADDGSTIGVDLVVTGVRGNDVDWEMAVDDALEPAP